MGLSSCGNKQFYYLAGDSKALLKMGNITDALDERGGYDGSERRGGSCVEFELITPSVTSSPPFVQLSSVSKTKTFIPLKHL